MDPIIERTFKIKGTADFPTGIYFKMIKLLKESYGYEVKKYKDWLEINPRSNYHQEMLQKKQALEQSVSRVMIGLSDVRRDAELIKHDLRRLEEVQSHFKENDEHVLKSDFVDLVDRNTGALSLIDLATTGKFPTIVVDFYKIRKEDDIKKLKITQTEKGILKKKWRLYDYWKGKYGKEINEKVSMLREQLSGRKASMRMYKDLLEPYVKAINKIKFSESEYTGLDDPNLIEGYDTSIAGVELLCWKGMSYEKEFEYREKKDEHKRGRYPYYSFIEIKIKRKSLTLAGKRTEKMEINFKVYLKTGEDIKELRKKVKERENLLFKEIEQFKGGEWKEEEEKKGEKSKLLLSIENGIRKIVGRPSAGEYYIPKGMGGKMEAIIQKKFIEFYDDMKDLVGGIKLKRY
ncbi:MAG: hypothetical protein KAT37_00360 [Candidatus Aenigmarchaeota archaeon]|nr:hypothetical protein [Candidatus Aenigmarchaeota archaeon]